MKYDPLRKARIWCLEQRKKELENAIKHWPNSDRLEERKIELADIEEQLREYAEGYA